jgi:hypothetical protein
MWRNLLLEVRKIEEKYGGSLNKPALREQVDVFEKAVQKKFNYILPDSYIKFLATVNGFEFNGFIVYGVDGLLFNGVENKFTPGYIESNEDWYENKEQQQYMFFGDSSISWYCLDIEKGIYVELDKPSGTIMHEYENFDVMLAKVLKDSLI